MPNRTKAIVASKTSSIKPRKKSHRRVKSSYRRKEEVDDSEQTPPQRGTIRHRRNNTAASPSELAKEARSASRPKKLIKLPTFEAVDFQSKTIKLIN